MRPVSATWCGAALVFLASCALIVDLPEGRDPATSAGGGASGSGGTAGTAGSAGSAPDAAAGSSGCVVACDCDGDLVENETCGGKDCADDDADVKPGQSTYMLKPSKNAKIGFDFDCSGSADREHTQAVKCLGLALTSCDTVTQGFLEALPECGQVGEWGTCKKGTLTCEKDVLQSKTMACK